MTGAELDEARIEEAWRIWTEPRTTPMPTEIRIVARDVARLAREGWCPSDPETLAAREILRHIVGVVSEMAANGGDLRTALIHINSGGWDGSNSMELILDSLRKAKS